MSGPAEIRPSQQDEEAAKSSGSVLTRQEEEEFERATRYQLQEERSLRLIGLRVDLENRHRLAHSVKWLIWCWLAFVASLLTGVAFGFAKLGSDILITLLATTTLNILGLLQIVCLYYFKKSN